MTPTDEKLAEIAARQVKALAFIKEMEEVTAPELGEHLGLTNPSGLIAHMFRKGKIKVRELQTSDTHGNRVKLYSLTTFVGAPRVYTGRKSPDFELGKHFGFFPPPKKEESEE